MILEIHDNEAGNTLAGRHGHLDYDYQAEEFVREIAQDYKGPFPLAAFILLDWEGERARWERVGDEMRLAWVSVRFTGQWVLGYGVKCRF